MDRLIERVLVKYKGLRYNDVLSSNTAYTGASVQSSQPNFNQFRGSLPCWLKASGDAGKQLPIAIDQSDDVQQSLKPILRDWMEWCKNMLVWTRFRAGVSLVAGGSIVILASSACIRR